MRHGRLLAIWMALTLTVTIGWVGSADANVLAEFAKQRHDEVAVRGFRLDSGQEVRVTSTGFGYRTGSTKFTLSNAWILDASSRAVVWELTDARDEWKEKTLSTESYTAELAAGDYEIYYSTYPEYRQRKWSGNSFFNIWDRRGRILDKLMDNEDVDDVEDLYRDFKLSVEGDGTPMDESAVKNRHEQMDEEAIVSIRKVNDHEYIERGFELKRPMKIRIYAVGEARKDGVYDYGWIVNAETGERVWRFTYDDSHHAGGAEKNRAIDSVFEADAGKYVVVYGTDGSHSYEAWNAAPPFDPMFWGLTLRAENREDAKYASTYDYQGRELERVVVELTQVGDDELMRKGFTLKKPMDLRIFALGEGRNGDMADYGWIVNATTRDRVWEMDYHDTEHAGGGDKNRMFDDVVHFDKGDYIVYYVTDGSHSYPHWNVTPPMDRKRWGVTVMGTEGFDKGDVAEYNEETDASYLVRLTEMGDDEYRSETFELSKDTRVRIRALGEAVNGRMYDYGWIEDAETGRVVWEMTYRKTRHAGGARKNREFNDTILLEKGKYKVFYETDGSHSFNDWNASKPYEPESWGIALRLVNNS